VTGTAEVLIVSTAITRLQHKDGDTSEMAKQSTPGVVEDLQVPGLKANSGPMYTISKPRLVHSQPKAARTADRQETEARRRVRILIVEDEAIPAMLLEEMVEDFGYVVCGKAISGPGAIMTAEDYEPDLILMDISLAQGTDGIEAATEIRNRLGIPSLFMSAYSDQATMARAKSAHPVGFVGKPYDEQRLRVALQAALKSLGLKP
jgi:CheY-like chemotaxis protein